MPTIYIDDQAVQVPAGATILQAARKLGVDIPALCYSEGCEANTSCMVCVVKVDGVNRLVPSCATRAIDGMRVESETDRIRRHRRTALELLLSEHLGDCTAPCHNICPARMNVPQMIRQIAAGRLREAIETVKADIALPASLGRICPAPCEKGCRRQHDDAVAICLLKRYVADVDLASGEPYLPPRAEASGKGVGIVGAGPTGLAAAYHLLQRGHACTLFDDHPAPGGMLRYGVDPHRLPHDVLDAEIDVIRQLGAEFRCGRGVGAAVPAAAVRDEFDAVLVAAGKVDTEASTAALGLEWDGKGPRADRRTYRTPTEGVFAACWPRQRKIAVSAVAAGKAAAAVIDQFLAGREIVAPARPYSVHIGKLQEGEIDHFLEGASDGGRVEPASSEAGFTEDEAVAEALRCLHCDCRRADDCKLRHYAEIYGADSSKYPTSRRTFQQLRQHADVVFEPGKCILCGLCIQIAQRAGERLGLTFVGRGFNTQVAVPFGASLAEGLEKAAAEVVAACPTGALAFLNDDRRSSFFTRDA